MGLRRICRPRTFHDCQAGAFILLDGELPTDRHLIYRFVLLTTCLGGRGCVLTYRLVGCVFVSIQSQCCERVVGTGLSRIGQIERIASFAGVVGGGFEIVCLSVGCYLVCVPWCDEGGKAERRRLSPFYPLSRLYCRVPLTNTSGQRPPVRTIKPVRPDDASPASYAGLCCYELVAVCPVIPRLREICSLP